MSDATITPFPRRDLPTPPTHNPAYYVEDEIVGLGSIYMHTPNDTWWQGGRLINEQQVPAGLKKLGVIE